MVSHFSANQYEDAFTSTKLRNWTVPRKYKKRPSTLEGYTQIIASDRGHLLRGAPRSNENPWGTFMGTWDMPCKIPPARPSYTARSNHAAKNLYVFKSDSSLNNAVNGYKIFGKTKKVQTSPFQRPGAPTPPRSNEQIIEPTVAMKSPKLKTESPVPENVRSPIPGVTSPQISKPPTPARSITPQRERSATPQSGKFISPRAESHLSHRSIPDNRSLHSACTV